MHDLVQPIDIDTGWENPPKIAQLKEDYTATESSHAVMVSKVDGWLHNLNPINSNQASSSKHQPFNVIKPSKNDGRSKLQPKLIRKQAEWRYTSLSEPFLNTPDIFKVLPVTAEDVHSSKQNQLVLNNQFNNQLNKVALIDKMVRTGVNEGTVILKVSWESITTKVMKEYPIYELVPARTQEDVQLLQEASQTDPSQLPAELLAAVKESQSSGKGYVPVPTGQMEEVEEEVQLKNQPAVEICDYRNVRVDPTCNGDIDAAEFVIYSYETNYANLEKAGIYSNLEHIKDDKVNSVIGSPDHESSWAKEGFKFSDAPRKKFVVTEYWGYWDIDGTGETKPIVAAWVGDVIIRLEENPYPDQELPFVIIQYLPVKNAIHGEPDGELLLDNQKVIGALTRGMIDSMGKSANGQTGVRKGSLDVVNKRRFEAGKDYEFNSAGDAQQSIYQHQFPEIPMSAYTLLNMQNNEAESLSGIKSFSNEGISGAGLGATAAAANGALSAAARREMGILRRYAEGVKAVGRKVIAMNAEFLSEEEVVRITAEEFVPVRRDDLAGKFDLELRISTAEADEQKAQELSFMLQTTGQAFGLEFTKIILAEIAELRKMPQLAKQIKEFSPQPDQHQQLMQQLELQEKQAEIAKIKADTQKILADAALSGYKSDNMQADTDKKNLDFVEQEAGVTQERDLQKQSAQAQANIDLEAFKVLTTPETQTAQ